MREYFQKDRVTHHTWYASHCAMHTLAISFSRAIYFCRFFGGFAALMLYNLVRMHACMHAWVWFSNELRSHLKFTMSLNCRRTCWWKKTSLSIRFRTPNVKWFTSWRKDEHAKIFDEQAIDSRTLHLKSQLKYFWCWETIMLFCIPFSSTKFTLCLSWFNSY